MKFNEKKLKEWKAYTRKELDNARADWYDLTLGELEFERQQGKDWVKVDEFSTGCDGNPASEYGDVNKARSKMPRTKVNSCKLGTI